MGAFVTLFNYIGYRLMLSLGIKPGRGRTVIRSLSHRHMEFAESWRNDLTLWPGASDAVLYRSNAGWAFTDAFYLTLADFCRDAAFFRRLFRRALRGQ